MKKFKYHILNKFFFNFFCIIFLFFCITQSSKATSILDIDKDELIIGDINAPVTIIEYASLSCHHCANFHVNTLPELIKEFVGTGKAKIVFRDFPFNYPALLGSMVLRCVPDNIRYQYSNALYQLQSKWVVRENAKTKQELYKIMQSGGMTKENFNNCIQNVELESEILKELIDAQNEFNIKSTPSFIINGILLEGNKPIKEFRQIINKILSE